MVEQKRSAEYVCMPTVLAGMDRVETNNRFGADVCMQVHQRSAKRIALDILVLS